MVSALLLPGVTRAQRVGVGLPAPAFSLSLLDSGQATLAQFRGRPVVINFWASWCGPCRTEIPEILAAYATHKAAGLEVLAINLTDQELRRHVQRFVTEMRMTFPVLLDTRGRTRRNYLLTGVPTTVFVDTAGVVRMIHPGPLTGDALSRGINLILAAQ